MAEDSPTSPAEADITFVVSNGGFLVRYAGRIADKHQDLVDESADWLENEMGVLNLGQIDYEVLMADGALTDEVRSGLLAWWAARVEDLTVGT